MIGGRGANYFDCGLNGNALILNFSPAKVILNHLIAYAITVPGSPLPPT